MKLKSIHVSDAYFTKDLVKHFESIGFKSWSFHEEDSKYVDIRLIKREDGYFIRKAFRGKGDKRVIITPSDLDSLMLITDPAVSFEYLRGCADDNSVLTY